MRYKSQGLVDSSVDARDVLDLSYIELYQVMHNPPLPVSPSPETIDS
jgi:hypothetical protein